MADRKNQPVLHEARQQRVRPNWRPSDKVRLSACSEAREDPGISVPTDSSGADFPHHGGGDSMEANTELL